MWAILTHLHTGLLISRSYNAETRHKTRPTMQQQRNISKRKKMQHERTLRNVDAIMMVQQRLLTSSPPSNTDGDEYSPAVEYQPVGMTTRHCYNFLFLSLSFSRMHDEVLFKNRCAEMRRPDRLILCMIMLPGPHIFITALQWIHTIVSSINDQIKYEGCFESTKHDSPAVWSVVVLNYHSSVAHKLLC